MRWTRIINIGRVDKKVCPTVTKSLATPLTDTLLILVPMATVLVTLTSLFLAPDVAVLLAVTVVLVAAVEDGFLAAHV